MQLFRGDGREIDCAVCKTVARAMKRATSALEGGRDPLE